MPYDANRPAEELEGRMLANRQLIDNSLFGSSKILDVNRCEPYENFHGPVIKFNSLSPNHWAGIAIMNNGEFTRTLTNSLLTWKELMRKLWLEADHLQDYI
jgi:hypothetical protein